MTFSKLIKQEIGQIKNDKDGNLAEFTAFLALSCNLVGRRNERFIEFTTRNTAIARRFLSITKALYQVQTQIEKNKIGTLKNQQIIKILILDNIDTILSEHDLLTDNYDYFDFFLKNNTHVAALLRGVFLCSGSVNDPKTSEYHLELHFSNKNLALKIQSIINNYQFDFRIILRKNNYILYLKKMDSIADFLQFIGAYDAYFKFHEKIINRDFYNSVNRLNNIDLANTKKSIEAANKQVGAIKIIQKHNYRITDSLKLVADLRMKYEDATLNELVDLYKTEYHLIISKSGLNHRLNRLLTIAKQIK